jgi:YHS domain-containing protein
MKNVCKIIVGLILPTFFALGQTANNEIALRKKHFNVENPTLAIQGYDAVSYFSNKPLKGNSKYGYNYKGITYIFSSSKNLETFKLNPEKYEPAYGGWCAYAMGAKGEKVEIDAENYLLLNGKVYLFYKNIFSNTKDDWKKDEKNLNKKADLNWITIYK